MEKEVILESWGSPGGFGSCFWFSGKRHAKGIFGEEQQHLIIRFVVVDRSAPGHCQRSMHSIVNLISAVTVAWQESV